MESPSERAVPARYVHQGRSTVETLRLSFVMNLREVEVLEAELLKRSNPKNREFYGKWLSLDDLSRFHPATDAVARLVSRLGEEGAVVQQVSRNGFITVDMPLADAEKLLECEFHAFKETVTKEVLHRSVNGLYSLPADLASDVSFVSGVRRLPVQLVGLRKKKPAQKGKRLGLAVTPKLIRKRYQTVGVTASAANNSMAVGSFIGQFYSPSDLTEFHTLFDPGNAGEQPTVHGPNQGAAGVEANLDVQYLGAVGFKVKKFYDWSTPGSDPNPFLDLFAELANMTEIPYLFSISYGEPEIGNTGSYLDRLSQEFMMATVRGTSILIASGDYGVTAQGQCPGDVFQPMWPVSSPWVTGVGGTKLGFLESGAEKVWSGSAGGFSDHFPIPDYQSAAVSTYQTAHAKSLPAQKYWNATGRGFPDIAAFGDGFLVVYNGAPTPVAGTSCATPTSSGVIALLNDIQLQAGKSTLGFLNPWLYQNAAALNDITDGSNEGCLGSDGFPATPGWDAVTGIGSPLYAKMKAVLP